MHWWTFTSWPWKHGTQLCFIEMLASLACPVYCACENGQDGAGLHVACKCVRSNLLCFIQSINYAHDIQAVKQCILKLFENPSDWVSASKPVVNDDNSVIAGWCEHAPGSLPCFGTTPIVDGRTQCMPLSAAVVNRRSAGRHAAPESMLVLTVARKPVARLPRGECSDQH